MIKHDAASTFVFYQFTDGWRLGLTEHPRWFTVGEVSGLAMPEDTRLLAGQLFSRIADLAAGILDDAVLRSFATAGS